MTDLNSLYHQIYKQNRLFGTNQKLKSNPFYRSGKRPNSVAVLGGAFGDEGKGRITDELTNRFLHRHSQVVHYRDNGGANAGHTVVVGNTKLALHQIGAGVLQDKTILISGKGMVLHPIDFVTEIESVKKVAQGKIPANLIIDELAVLSLDTHRAFEAALKVKAQGSLGSTGRGIAPAYADIIYRHPLRMRDLASRNWRQPFTKHYLLYQDLLKGFGLKLAQVAVLRLNQEPVTVGSPDTFLSRLESTRNILIPFIQPVHQLLHEHWHGTTPFVFEKAQALGLDTRWGVYPDVTASDCSLTGIHSSTEGLVQPDHISATVAVIKATYTSSVGKRVMPSNMNIRLAQKIRDDAHEYGTTTGRPRDIHYIDLPFLTFLRRVGGYQYLAPTHLDIAYPNIPIKIVVSYTKNNQEVPYRPDQRYLLQVKPQFLELPSWDGHTIQNITKLEKLPKTTLQYLAFISQALKVKLLMATVGPKRHQTLKWF